MEVIVPRTKAHATAIYSWNGNVVPNLYNVFPKYNGAQNIFNWTGRCKGQPCTFWMTDNGNGDVACGGFEPNGDNNVIGSMYYQWQANGDIQWHNDIPGDGYSSSFFMCDVGDKLP